MALFIPDQYLQNLQQLYASLYVMNFAAPTILHLYYFSVVGIPSEITGITNDSIYSNHFR